MRALLVICALVVACLAPDILASRILDRCSLAREMTQHGVPRDQLAHWACIAEKQSNYHTDAVSPANKEGFRSYGIFQISNQYWCYSANETPREVECRTVCEVFLEDDIGMSVMCARKIQEKQGWSAWPGCTGSLPSIDDCF
ncbi:lysozyme P-like [Drosophila guanche]|uniref:lysozyme n=1 Tax=Drosophila guanche TaxID=7266 RepID=A0A3B0KGB4_DROGU|nr:lysozyme P-like [Drosophila guanche]SPP84776.1 blast:Lysozyme P [Drosophila guanche]